MKAILIGWTLTAVVLVTGCGGGDPTATNPSATAVKAAADESKVQAAAVDRQIQVEDALVSIFENLTLEIQYGYIENLNDGRGYTAGRAGFTSGTGDLLNVVQTYASNKPGNVLEPYLPALQAVNGTSSVDGLDGFVDAWKSCASDPAMIAAQDTVNEVLYRKEARQLATQLGAVLPLSKAALYEAGIQHGYGSDGDSIPQIAQRASAQVGGTPASGVDEKTWLRALLEERRNDLLSPANADTAEEWAASVDRANAMLSIYDTGNFDLTQQISFVVFDKTFSF